MWKLGIALPGCRFARPNHEYQANNYHYTQNKVSYRLTHLHGIPPIHSI